MEILALSVFLDSITQLIPVLLVTQKHQTALLVT